MSEPTKIGIIGLGSLGTALAQILAKDGHQVIGWAHSQKVTDDINQNHRNSKYFPHTKLEKNITATSDLSKLATHFSFTPNTDTTHHVLLLCIPSNHLNGTLSELAKLTMSQQTIIINTAKGLHTDSAVPVFEAIKTQFPHYSVAQISGPMIASELITGNVTAGIIACEDKHTEFLKTLFAHTNLHLNFSADVTGVVWCGILKNIYAIGVGMLDSLTDNNTNAKGIYLTKALEEMSTFVKLKQGKTKTVYGVAGVGDLITTSLSHSSHNRTFGCRIADEPETADSGYQPEGCHTLQVFFDHSDQEMIEHLPLAYLTYQYTQLTLSLEEWYERSMKV